MRRTQSSYIANYREIGKKIAFYRREKNLTQEQLAQKIGISKSYLSKIESVNSTESFSLDVMFSIADGLNLNAALFLQPLDMVNPDNIYTFKCLGCGQEVPVKFCSNCGTQLASTVVSQTYTP